MPPHRLCLPVLSPGGTNPSWNQAEDTGEKPGGGAETECGAGEDAGRGLESWEGEGRCDLAVGPARSGKRRREEMREDGGKPGLRSGYSTGGCGGKAALGMTG